MYTLKTVIESGEIHYSIIKHENGLVKLIESFDYNEYSQALKILKACQYGKSFTVGDARL